MDGEEKKKIGFSIGIFDNISEKVKQNIMEETKKYEVYGIGVYSDAFIMDKFMTYPLKKIEERMKDAKEINGVDFTFEIDTSDTNKVKEIIEKKYKEYLLKK